MDEHTRLRSLPAVGKLLHDTTIRKKFADTPHALLVAGLSYVLRELRQSNAPQTKAQTLPAPEDRLTNAADSLAQPGLLDDAAWARETSVEGIAHRVERWLQHRFAPHLRPVINLTGTIIHTNLGRAPLGERALHAVATIARGYSNLEFEVGPGARGSRHSHVESLLCELTGAEAAMAVNNNAAAVLLVLSTIGAGGDGIVSRGQLVEIGGSFRIPDIMAYSGVNLVEVGTTNKTRIGDYERAITDETKVILRVHTSNYRIVGFTEQPERQELAKLATAHHIPLFEDLGSGALFDYQTQGIGDEPTVKACLRAGVDVVSFSGDKLLGGAQAGIIVGKKAWIDKMKHHPLARALRVDKMTLAALEATLMDHLDDTLAKSHIPVVRMVTESYDDVAARAAQLAETIRRDEKLSKILSVQLEDGESTIGGGSFPGETLPTRILALHARGVTAVKFAEELRTLPSIPIVSRVSRDAVHFDVRTLLPGEEMVVMISLREWSRERAQSGASHKG
ncbi:L-seryl-tRNA(Sec) selenium transferase [Alicyclobacillus mengziensis]|uniref:L-seryl-tRNA(Sec) selenium transferase n=1 Tax=Alicyclobacillus mengziensis TaxID=2931921 RepID=A0A9X7VX84_9BACL|nr:L-seryl-tRNA(Sec) selenium transferase [Alicyclobacillus mengziensis]QSO46152.1 L-seryl-tRNA(Sec) selenium transferase [Alicyclobacillus mengziensis]